MTVTEADIAAVFREEHGRAVSVLIRVLGDLELAEDAVQDAFEVAVRRWPVHGIPPSPAGWIITTARRRAIDHLRREATRDERHRAASQLREPEAEEVGAVPDERLRLMFVCAHPALAPDARVALTLRMLGGLSTAEIGRAFLVPEATMAQRIVRAKRKIKATGIRYQLPREVDLPERLDGVLAVLYLIFNEGYLASSGSALARDDLSAEAIRLTRALVALLPDKPEPQGLLALMLLTESRRAARTDRSGDLVLLADQDRSRWDAGLVAEGHALVRRCLDRGMPGRYQIQAAINAVHADAETYAQTDWASVLALYDQLMTVAPSPVAALNRAVALAEVEGAAAALEAAQDLPLEEYHAFHVVRGDLLDRLGRRSEARASFARAAQLTENDAQRRYLLSRAGERRSAAES